MVLSHHASALGANPSRSSPIKPSSMLMETRTAKSIRLPSVSVKSHRTENDQGRRPLLALSYALLSPSLTDRNDAASAHFGHAIRECGGIIRIVCDIHHRDP